jgi:hypothetical protein
VARFNPAVLNQIEKLAYYFGGLDASAPKFSEGELSVSKFDQLEEDIRRQVLVLFARASSAGAFTTDIDKAMLNFVGTVDQEEASGTELREAANALASTVVIDGIGAGFGLSDMIGGEESTAGAYPTKFQPGLSAIQVFPIKHNFANRNADLLDVFFNSIPNVEFSRCVPYFDMSVISPGMPVSTTGMSLTLNQHAFLSPNDALTDAQRSKANASTVSDAEGITVKDYIGSGMELFTSPQTLVNGDEEYFEPGTSESGGKGVLDKFKPFMTIKNFTVTKAPSGMNTEYETAKLQIALHDRSRLSQITGLVAPTAYRSTEILVEYGWSHPDGQNSPGTNPIGDFLNALRTKVKYGIKNSSYSFTADGGVEINLELSMKGTNETFSAEITDGEGFSRLEDKLAELNAVFAEKVNELHGGNAILEDVIGQTIIKAASSTSSALKIDKATADEIAKTIEDLKKGEGDAKSGMETLAKLLTDMFGTDGSNGMAKQVNDSPANSFKTKMEILKNGTDFFASAFPKPGIPDCGPVQPWSARPSTPTSIAMPQHGYCTLGKLLLLFVGKPLQATNQFDEVQFIFYGVNRSAGFVRHHNIAQFPIKIQDFEDLMKARFGNSLNIDIQTFLNFVNKEFIMPQYAEAYGLNGLYDISTDDKGNRTVKTANNLDDSALDSSKQQILKQAYAAEEPAELKTVNMRVSFDCVPAAIPKEEGEGFDIDVTKTILRLYVTDQHAAGIDPINMLLESMTKDGLHMVTNGNADSGESASSLDNPQDISSGHGAYHAEFLAKAQAAGLLEIQQTDDIQSPEGKTNLQGIIKVVPNRGKLKEFIRQQMPSCIIGSTGCPVYNASLSSMNDPRLATIEMQRMTKGDSKNVGAMAGNVDVGLPTFVKPNELSIDMFGLPALRYQTVMFFDFNTDTNADGMYYVKSVDHSFAPGEFKTSAKFANYSSFEKFRDPIEGLKRRLADASAEIDKETAGEDTSLTE